MSAGGGFLGGAAEVRMGSVSARGFIVSMNRGISRTYGIDGKTASTSCTPAGRQFFTSWADAVEFALSAGPLDERCSVSMEAVNVLVAEA